MSEPEPEIDVPDELRHDWSYKTKVRKPTPEEEAILKRWREEVDQRVQARLRAYYGR